MKMLLNDEMCHAVPVGWVTIFADSALIQQVMEINGEDMGKAADLIRTYEEAVNHYNETGETDCLEKACESERELRIILKTGRLRQALGLS